MLLLEIVELFVEVGYDWLFVDMEYLLMDVWVVMDIFVVIDC